MRARRNRKRRARPGAWLRCSGISSRVRGRRLISTDTGRPRERASSPCSNASCCPPSARSRSTAFRLGGDRAMVRPLQPDRPRQRQSRARPSHADYQFRHRPRPPRNQPGAGREKEPETDAHALSVPRGDIARLHHVLDRQTRDSRREQADIIRLLLLTGCRRSEILRLRWSEVDRDRLVLADGKTGPRIVPLNTPARRILERRPRGGSPFVFPSPRDPARPRNRNLPFWYRARREAGIEDVRLHDLRVIIPMPATR